MDVMLHKKILKVSLLSILFLILLTAGGVFLNNDAMIALPGAFTWIAFAAIISTFSLKYKEIKWFKIITKYSLFVFPFLLALCSYLALPGVFSVFLLIISLMLILVSLLVLIQLFLFAEASSLTGTIILMLLIVIGIIMKKYHWYLAGEFMTGSTTMLVMGSYMYAIRCLFMAGKMTYFRNITFFGSVIISMAFFGQMFKMQHWPGAGPLVIFGLASLILGTLYLLITLPSSGFIEWDSLHKKILRRILIPWTFIFLLYISRYMVPELNTLLWTSVQKEEISTYGFEMKDYDINNRK